MQFFYKLCSKRFGLNIWVPIPIQWFENMSGCNTAYAKNQLHPCLLWTCFAMTSKNDTTFMQKIILIPPSFLKYYKDIANLFWVHWAFVRPHPPKAIAPTCRKQLVTSIKQKFYFKNPSFFLVILPFKEYCNLIDHILGNNSRTRILPDMGFAMESQELKGFYIVFRKNKWQNIQKNEKISYFWALCTKIWTKMNFPQKLGSVTFPHLYSLFHAKNQTK